MVNSVNMVNSVLVFSSLVLKGLHSSFVEAAAHLKHSPALFHQLMMKIRTNTFNASASISVISKWLEQAH